MGKFADISLYADYEYGYEEIGGGGSVGGGNGAGARVGMFVHRCVYIRSKMVMQATASSIPCMPPPFSAIPKRAPST